MLQTGELAADVGSVIYGEEAVELGLIDRIGGLSDALSLSLIHIFGDPRTVELQQQSLT